MPKVKFHIQEFFAEFFFFRCNNLNFSSRTKCNGTLQNENGDVSTSIIHEITTYPQACLLAKPEFEKYGVALVKSKMMRKDGDWNCYRCGNINFQVFIGPMCTWGPIIGSPCPSLHPSNTFLKPCEDLVKTVNVVNVVKI